MPAGKMPSDCAARWGCTPSCTLPSISICLSARTLVFIDLIVPEFLQKYYLWASLPAFIVLLALAATSFRWAMRRLGRNWKRLHRFIYLGAILVVLHLALVIKGDFFRLGGDVWKPAVAAIVFGALLIVRLPPIRHALLALKQGSARAAPRTAVPPTSSKLAED